MKLKFLYPHIGLASFRPALLIDHDGLPSVSTASALANPWRHQTLLTNQEFERVASAGELQTAVGVLGESEEAIAALVLVCQVGCWQHRLAIPLHGDVLLSRLNASASGVTSAVVEVVYTNAQTTDSVNVGYKLNDEHVREMLALSLNGERRIGPAKVWQRIGARALALHASRAVGRSLASSAVTEIAVAVSWPVELELPADVLRGFKPPGY